MAEHGNSALLEAVKLDDDILPERVLSPDELRMAREEDRRILAQVKLMSGDELRQVHENFKEIAPKHYGESLASWLREYWHFMGEHIGRSPSQHEVYTSFLEEQQNLRHMAFYVLKYPLLVISRRGRILVA